MAEGDGSEHLIGSETPAPEASLHPNSGKAVFISYASQDAVLAEALCAALEREGVACWIAPRNVRPGDFYADAIVQAINACPVVVLVLSKNSVDSAHVLREVERASAKKRPVITFRIDSAVLPPGLEYFLSASQWIDASGGPPERGFPKLVEALRGRTASTPKTESGPRFSVRRPAKRSLNRIVIAVTAVVGAALVYFIADKFWLSKHITAGQPTTTATNIGSDKSIAVLPFTDMSEKKDQEYFSDGMAEEIIDLLVKVPDLKVPARTSSFYFKGKSTQIPEIARELGVAHVLEGSVRKSGDHLRVTAQLVRADNGYHLWSETYDRQMNDVFKTQDEIAGAVVKALKVSLLKGEPPGAKLTASSEAYELYLQARALINQETSDDTIKAYADLQQAVSLDPKFAQAWATLANILTQDNVDWTRVFQHVDSASPTEGNPLQEWGLIWAQARAAAHAAAEQAVRLGPDLAESHAAMAQVLAWLDWDWAGADAQLKRALELEHGNARVTQAAADISIELGRLSEGIQLANHAAALDPLGHAYSTIAWGQYADRALDEAQVSSRKWIELYPTSSRAHYHYALVLLARGEPQAALSEFELENLVPFREVGLPLALDALGRHSDADQAIAIAEQKDANGMAYQLAYIYASRKDIGRAFYWLERAYRQHDGGLAELKIDPMFRSLERDLRYKALLRKMNLPE